MNSMEAYVARRMPLVPKLIIPLNSRGITLDTQKLAEFQRERSTKMRTWQSRARKHFKSLDLGDLPIGPKGGFSNPKLRDLVYGRLGLPEQKDPKDQSKVTCNKDALKHLSKKDKTGTIDLLLENSKLAEARTALQVIPDPDGRVRTRFVFGGDEKWDQDEAGKESPGSGRLASRDPNLQNVPEWVRAIYVPRHPDRWLLKADYSQIEMRLIAHLSRDPELLKAVATDAHLYIMFLVDGVTGLYGLASRGFRGLLRDYRAGDPDVVFARDETKRTDYGWGYRMGAKKLELVRGVPFARGKKALHALNQAFPRVVLWWEALVEEVRRVSGGSGLGYLTNEYGRIRRLFLDDVPKICNFKPQSLAADILFDAMEELEGVLAAYDSELLLTIHDEVVIDTPDPEELIPRVREIMERPKPELGGLSIPTDFLVGKNWAKAHEHSKSCKAHCEKHENKLGQKPWEEWL